MLRREQRDVGVAVPAVKREQYHCSHWLGRRIYRHSQLRLRKNSLRLRESIATERGDRGTDDHLVIAAVCNESLGDAPN